MITISPRDFGSVSALTGIFFLTLPSRENRKALPENKNWFIVLFQECIGQLK